jgi:hypothetical protein
VEPSTGNIWRGYDGETGGNANVIFAQLPQSANTSISQLFDVAAPPVTNIHIHPKGTQRRLPTVPSDKLRDATPVTEPERQLVITR